MFLCVQVSKRLEFQEHQKTVTLTNFFYFLIKMGIIVKDGKCNFFWFYMSTNAVSTCHCPLQKKSYFQLKIIFLVSVSI